MNILHKQTKQYYCTKIMFCIWTSGIGGGGGNNNISIKICYNTELVGQVTAGWVGELTVTIKSYKGH